MTSPAREATLRRRPATASSLTARGNGTWEWIDDYSVTRVCVYEGRIAWVHCSDVGVFLSERLATAVGVSLEILGHHLAVCRASGQRLGEYLVANRVITAARFRAVLHAHTREHWSAFVGVERGPGHFVPRTDRYDRQFTFAIPELAPPSLDPALSVLLDRVAELAGVSAAVIIDARQCVCVGQRGREGAIGERIGLHHVPWWRAIQRATPNGCRAVMMSGPAYHELACPADDDLFVWIMVRRDEGAPVRVMQLLEQYLEPTT